MPTLQELRSIAYTLTYHKKDTKDRNANPLPYGSHWASVAVEEWYEQTRQNRSVNSISSSLLTHRACTTFLSFVRATRSVPNIISQAAHRIPGSTSTCSFFTSLTRRCNAPSSTRPSNPLPSPTLSCPAGCDPLAAGPSSEEPRARGKAATPPSTNHLAPSSTPSMDPTPPQTPPIFAFLPRETPLASYPSSPRESTHSSSVSENSSCSRIFHASIPAVLQHSQAVRTERKE